MSVDLAANAIINESDLAAVLSAGTLNVDDARRVCNVASDLAQQFLRRNLRAPASAVVEYHSFEEGSRELYVIDYPVVSVTSIYEDRTRVYGASTQLTEASDFVVSKNLGRITRVVPGGGVRAWACGFRSVKVTYTYGFALADVPARYKDFAGQIAALIWAEKKRGQFGVTGMSDSLGNFTRVSASHLPTYITESVMGDRAPIGGSGERD